MKISEAETLLREARKIMLANSVARNLNKDFLQRVADFLKKAERGRDKQKADRYPMPPADWTPP